MREGKVVFLDRSDLAPQYYDRSTDDVRLEEFKGSSQTAACADVVLFIDEPRGPRTRILKNRYGESGLVINGIEESNLRKVKKLAEEINAKAAAIFREVKTFAYVSKFRSGPG